MSKYLPNNRWVFDAGDDVHGRTNAAGALIAFVIDYFATRFGGEGAETAGK